MDEAPAPPRRLPWARIAAASAGVLLVSAGILLLWTQMGGEDEAPEELPPVPGGGVSVEAEKEDERTFDGLLERFFADAILLDGGDLRAATFHVLVKDSGTGNASYEGRFDFYWGVGNVLRADNVVRALPGAFCPITYTTGVCYEEDRYCTSDLVSLVVGREVRIRRAPMTEDGSHCLADRQVDILGSLRNPDLLAGLELFAVQYHDDGNITGLYRNADRTQGMEVRADSGMVLRGFSVSTPTSNLEVTVYWGVQPLIPVPPGSVREATQALVDGPASQSGSTARVWTVRWSREAAFVEDLEARVYPAATQEERARFPLVPGQNQEAGGVIFSFDDINRDGRFTEGDRMFLSAAAGNPVTEYRIVLYDLWAQANVQAPNPEDLNLTPGPGALGLLAALGAALAAAHRRRA